MIDVTAGGELTALGSHNSLFPLPINSQEGILLKRDFQPWCHTLLGKRIRNSEKQARFLNLDPMDISAGWFPMVDLPCDLWSVQHHAWPLPTRCQKYPLNSYEKQKCFWIFPNVSEIAPIKSHHSKNVSLKRSQTVKLVEDNIAHPLQRCFSQHSLHELYCLCNFLK